MYHSWLLSFRKTLDMNLSLTFKHKGSRELNCFNGEIRIRSHFHFLHGVVNVGTLKENLLSLLQGAILCQRGSSTWLAKWKRVCGILTNKRARGWACALCTLGNGEHATGVGWGHGNPGHVESLTEHENRKARKRYRWVWCPRRFESSQLCNSRLLKHLQLPPRTLSPPPPPPPPHPTAANGLCRLRSLCGFLCNFFWSNSFWSKLNLPLLHCFILFVFFYMQKHKCLKK